MPRGLPSYALCPLYACTVMKILSLLPSWVSWGVWGTGELFKCLERWQLVSGHYILLFSYESPSGEDRALLQIWKRNHILTQGSDNWWKVARTLNNAQKILYRTWFTNWVIQNIWENPRRQKENLRKLLSHWPGDYVRFCLQGKFRLKCKIMFYL